MRPLFILALILFGAVARGAFAGEEPSAEVFGSAISKIGDWNVYKKSDAMTDKASCMAVYKNRASIQLAADSFAVSLQGKGGVEGYYLRLDDQPPSSLQLATEVEKKISALVFEGGDFEKIRASRRVRLRVLTLLNSSVDEDIDLANMQHALDFITGPKCK